MMKLTRQQSAAIKAANKILNEAGLPSYNIKLHPTLHPDGPTKPLQVDLSKLVRVSPNPLKNQWEVAGGTSRHHRRIGRYVGVVEITNCRAYGILLEFPEGDVQAFSSHDLFPWNGKQVEFPQKPSETKACHEEAGTAPGC